MLNRFNQNLETMKITYNDNLIIFNNKNKELTNQLKIITTLITGICIYIVNLIRYLTSKK